MDIITIDWETYYAKDYSLGKLTTEEYVRGELFEEIGIGVKVNDAETIWLSGTRKQLKEYLHANYDWENSALLAHNTMFDGFIFSHHFDIYPKLYLDTLCMARALHGVETGGSLAKLAEQYNIGVKGTEVVEALGKRRKDFSEEELSAYGDYCINDVDLCYELFGIFMQSFPKKELKVIDMTLRMFIIPTLDLDDSKLKGHIKQIEKHKDLLLADCGITKPELMSNPKFAKALELLGVTPPMKTSLRTGKQAFAFAKKDAGLVALQAHPDENVRLLVEARLGLKSTLEETRTTRFLDIKKRGLLPVPIKYYAAHTGRWGGADKINLQNLPSRGVNGKVLKSCMVAPHGYTLIEADSAQIEARVLAWLAEQNNLLDAFTKGEDVYKLMAADIYNCTVDDVTPAQRFIGKQTILGAGYGMGAPRFQEQLRGEGVDITLDEAQVIIRAYRDKNTNITNLWKTAGAALKGMLLGDKYAIGRSGVLSVVPDQNAIRLPSGLLMRYDGLDAVEGDKGLQYSYQTRKGPTNIYGGKVIENVCQGIARCVMSDQMLKIQKKTPILLTVHDSVVCCVLDSEVDETAAFIGQCMGETPEWAEGLPVRGDVEIGKNYGEVVEWGAA